MSASRSNYLNCSVMPSIFLPIIIQVSKLKKGTVVDARCRDLTSASTLEKAQERPGSVPTCTFHDVSS